MARAGIPRKRGVSNEQGEEAIRIAVRPRPHVVCGALRRPLVAPIACAVCTVCAAAAAALVACVSGGQVTVHPGPDATADGGTDAAIDAPEEPLVLADVCGNPPYVTLGIVVVALSIDDPDGAPFGGAEFTSPLCPQLVQYSNDAGMIQGQVSANTPFYGRLQATDLIPELIPELEVDADSTGRRIEMLPTSIESLLFPTFDASASTAIIVAAETIEPDAGACSTLDGISFSVPGHPEAQVTYFSAGLLPTPVTGATATTTRGLAAVTGLSAGQFVTLAATKTGCSILFKHDSLTGRVPLETGFVSLMPAYLSP